MLCLGIETTCDETALALLRDGRVLAEEMASQMDMHAPFGGVVPELASREHLRVLPPLLDRLVHRTGTSLKDLDAIAVARGPGLLGSILIGLGLAKGLALSTGATLVGVNHLQAHLLAPGMDQLMRFPALGLLISGGHTRLYLIHSPLQFELLGRTLDDAVGEAFDKSAKLLNFPYPGGMHIDALSAQARPDRSLFPCPYLENTNLDFSFSGLKTAVAQFVQRHPELKLEKLTLEPDHAAIAAENPELATVCSSLNWSIAQTLSVKVQRALSRHQTIRSLIVAGGVAANRMIRRTMQDLTAAQELPLLLPRPELCTDNGTMIAYCGSLFLEAGLCHDLSLEAIPRGKPLPWDYQQRPLLLDNPVENPDGAP